MTNQAYFLAAVLAVGASCCRPVSAQQPVEASISDHSALESVPAPPVGGAVPGPVPDPRSSAGPAGLPLRDGPSGVPYRSAATLPAPPPSCTSCTDSCPECRPAGPLRRRWREQWKPLMQETHWGYCNYFEPVPYGAPVHEAIARQLAKAYRERLVLYQADFRAADDTHPEILTDRGRLELTRILQDMQIVPGLILIEYSRTDRGLDQRRQKHVQDVLQTLGSGVPAEAVVVGPAPGGLSGLEALNVFGNFLQSSRSGAAGGSASTTGGGSGVGVSAGVGASGGLGGGSVR